MKIAEVTVRNFKCFEALDLPCAPLTVLTGHNGAGKSTALQSLLLMAQGLRTNPDWEALPLNGDLVTLGTGREVLHDQAEPLCLGAQGGEESSERVVWTFGYDPQLGRHGVLPLRGTSYSEDGQLRKTANSFQAGMVPESRLLPALRDAMFLSGDRNVSFQSTAVPRSMVTARASIPGDVGTEGEYAAYWYRECVDEEVSADRRKHGAEEQQTVRAQVDAWLGDFFPGALIQARQLDAASPIQLSFRLGEDSPWARPRNVGYGLVHAFPMVVCLLTARAGSVIVMDSAEAHLHPRAQSAAGRMLGQMAGAGLQILIETHSDHLLNGVRLAVRDGLLPPEDVAVHFFSHAGESGPSGVTAMSVDRNGAIDHWPPGFFDQAEQDLAVLAGWD